MTKALTSSRNIQSNRQPARKRRGTAEPRAERPSPRFLPWSELLTKAEETLGNQQSRRLQTPFRGNPLIAQNGESRCVCVCEGARLFACAWTRKGGKKSVACSVRSQIWILTGHRPLTSWILVPLVFPRLRPCANERLLHSGAKAHIDEEGAQGCCCCRW